MKAILSKTLALLVAFSLLVPVFGAAPVMAAGPDDPAARAVEIAEDAEFVLDAAPSTAVDAAARQAWVLIELTSAPVLGREIFLASEEAYLQQLEDVQATVRPQLEALDVQVVSSYQRVYNGFLARVPEGNRAAVLALPNVKAVHAAPIHVPALSNSVPFIGAPEVWDMGYDGEGVNIAILDTGIDYTHDAFGGSGDPAVYAADNHNVVTDTTFPTAKVVGGWDFAGPLYDAGCTAQQEADGICSTTPDPDPDPIDVHGHGTHVASTAAGIMGSNVYSGVAPMANLFALKIFGDRTGSTGLTIDALEWVADWNATASMTETIHVINMSIGSDFGPAEEEDEVAIDNLVSSGVVVVSSAGNGGQDARYITGSPASADAAIAVAANTVDYTGYLTAPTVSIMDSGYPTQTNRPYAVPVFDDDTGLLSETLTGTLVFAGDEGPDKMLCTTTGFADDAFDGMVALISRGGCAFTAKVNNAASLGAIGAIIYNNAGPFLVNMGGGPVVIPAVFVGQEDGENFIPAAGEMVEISANDDLTGGIDVDYPGDWTASFSSIGPRSYDSALKPEVSAPGVNINAAAVGSGTGTASMQGTSMASPHLAGVAALLKQARPNWTVEQIKAAIMNTAVDMDPESTSPINIPTVGAGRVDAQAATETMAVAVGDEDLVSLSFGVIFDGDGDGDGMKTVSKDVTLYNWESTTQTFAVTSTFQTGSWTTGIMVETDVDEVMVPAGGMATVMVTVTVETGKIPVVYGLLEEVYGFVKFTNTATDAMLRVPFYFSPRPYTELEVTGDGTIMDPVNDVLTYAITHTGAISSSLYPMDALIKDSEELTESQHVDINMVGAETWVGGYGTVVSLGIDTYGYWTTPSSHLSALEVYVDLDEDGTDDIKLYPYNLSQWQYGSISDPDDSWILLQDTLATTQTVEQNLASPYFIYTDYNSGYTEWYIVASWIGVSAANPDFDFWVKTESWEGYEDMTAKADYSIVAPAFNVDVPAALGPYAPVGAVKVSIASAEGYNAYEPLGVMLLDYNGDPREGGQAYYMPITVENLADVTIDKMVETAMTPVAPGETVTYTVVLANASDTVTATDVTMLDELPVVMAFGEWIEEPAGTTQVGRTISWMGDLYPSDVFTFTFTADLYEQDQTNYLGLEEIVNVATHDYVGGGSDAATFPIQLSFNIYLPLTMQEYDG